MDIVSVYTRDVLEDALAETMRLIQPRLLRKGFSLAQVDKLRESWRNKVSSAMKTNQNGQSQSDLVVVTSQPANSVNGADGRCPLPLPDDDPRFAVQPGCASFFSQAAAIPGSQSSEHDTGTPSYDAHPANSDTASVDPENSLSGEPPNERVDSSQQQGGGTELTADDDFQDVGDGHFMAHDDDYEDSDFGDAYDEDDSDDSSDDRALAEASLFGADSAATAATPVDTEKRHESAVVNVIATPLDVERQSGDESDDGMGPEIDVREYMYESGEESGHEEQHAKSAAASELDKSNDYSLLVARCVGEVEKRSRKKHTSKQDESSKRWLFHLQHALLNTHTHHLKAIPQLKVYLKR